MSKSEAAVLVVILGAQTAVEYAARYLIKEPMYDSIFTGAAWVQELLNWHKTLLGIGCSRRYFGVICSIL
jgi:hypothetical protein